MSWEPVLCDNGWLRGQSTLTVDSAPLNVYNFFESLPNFSTFWQSEMNVPWKTTWHHEIIVCFTQSCPTLHLLYPSLTAHTMSSDWGLRKQFLFIEDMTGHNALGFLLLPCFGGALIREEDFRICDLSISVQEKTPTSHQANLKLWAPFAISEWTPKTWLQTISRHFTQNVGTQFHSSLYGQTRSPFLFTSYILRQITILLIWFIKISWFFFTSFLQRKSDFFITK